MTFILNVSSCVDDVWRQNRKFKDRKSSSLSCSKQSEVWLSFCSHVGDRYLGGGGGGGGSHL